MHDFRVVGLCAAPFTPFHADGSLDLPSVQAHVDELVRQGVGYAFVAGTTGEGVTMSVEERKQLLEAWVAASRGKPLAIIAHIGAESIADVQALATHAEATGVAALGAHCTTFNKPPTLDAVVDFLGIISKSAWVAAGGVARRRGRRLVRWAQAPGFRRGDAPSRRFTRTAAP
jgi:N-acetylneuraminate lyase